METSSGCRWSGTFVFCLLLIICETSPSDAPACARFTDNSLIKGRKKSVITTRELSRRFVLMAAISSIGDLLNGTFRQPQFVSNSNPWAAGRQL